MKTILFSIIFLFSFSAFSEVTGEGEIKYQYKVSKNDLLDFSIVHFHWPMEKLPLIEPLKLPLGTEQGDILLDGKPEAQIPSNYYIPYQKESYLFKKFKLEKSNFKISTDESLASSYLHASQIFVPISTLVTGILQKKSLANMANDFSFKSGTFVKTPNTLNFKTSIKSGDIAYDKNIKTPKVSISNTDAVLAFALGEFNGAFFVSDLKFLYDQKSTHLSYSSAHPSHTLFVRFPDSGTNSFYSPQVSELLFHNLKRWLEPTASPSPAPSAQDSPEVYHFSSVLKKEGSKEAVEFLDYISEPQLVNNSYSITPPNEVSSNSFQRCHTYHVVSELIITQQDFITSEKRKLLFTKKHNGWLNTLKNISVNRDPNKEYRLEVIFTGTTNGNCDNATHITKNGLTI